MKGIVNIGAIVLVGAILIAAAIGMGIIDLTPPATIITGGLTITSIDPVNVQLRPDGTATGFFRVTAVANRGSESIIGTVSPSDFEQETGFETKRSFTIELSDLKETARYQVNNFNPQTAFFLTREFGCIVQPDWRCTGANLCVNKQNELIRAPINLPSIKSEVDVSVTIGSLRETVSISSDQPSNQFSFGNVQWVGGLSTGNLPPSPGDFEATFDKERERSWKIVRTTNPERNTYLNEVPVMLAFLDNACPLFFGDTNRIINRIESFNVLFDNYKSQDDTFSLGFEWMNRQSETGAVTLDFNQPIATLNPLLVFTVDAEEVGILVKAGRPRINDASSPVFNSGDLQGRIDVSVTNVGDSSGSFAFSLDDCASFSQSFSITGVQFAQGETKTTVIPIKTTGAAVDTTETCTVEVCDTSGFGTCDTASVTITMREARLCTEGRQIIDGSCIKVCQNNELVVQECCSVYEIIGTDEDGNFECQEGFGGGGGAGIFDFIIKFLVLFFTSAIIAGIITFIIFFFRRLPSILFLIIWLGLTAIIMVAFSPFAFSVAATLFAGALI